MEKNQLRKEYGYTENAFILVYAAEFNPGKNHKFIVDALPQLVKDIPNLKVIFAGIGELMQKMIDYTSQLGLMNYIDFTGYRYDVEKLMAISDVGISPGKMEGLPMNVAEAMFCGLPVVVTRIRGHVDLVEHGKNGLLFEPGDRKMFIRHILYLFRSKELRKQLEENSKESIIPFGIREVLPQMTEIYKKYL